MVLVGPSWWRVVKFCQGGDSGCREIPRFALSSNHGKVGIGSVLCPGMPETLAVGYWSWGAFEMVTVFYWVDLLSDMSRLYCVSDGVGFGIQGSMTGFFWEFA